MPAKSSFSSMFAYPLQLWILLLLSIRVPEPVFSRLITRYIDNEYGDLATGEGPEYIGTGWIHGGNCTDCTRDGMLQPDPKQVFSGTWHDNTRYRGAGPSLGIQFNFTGISLSIYCILPNSPPPLVSQYALSFILDGELVEHFTHSPDFTSNFLYNHTVFSTGNLSNTSHTMEVRLDSETMDSVILFDYARYIFDDGFAVPKATTSNLPPTDSPSDNGGISKKAMATIIVLACLLGALGGGGALMVLIRRYRTIRHGGMKDSTSVLPFDSILPSERSSKGQRHRFTQSSHPPNARVEAEAESSWAAPPSTAPPPTAPPPYHS
ncbi:hypothetical protein WG66_013528 [Moniliophthora roreri]|uniref:Uncharacterized protein n=1 Tax=Moniliophthora roreri TaxID=221103 RepID=A0A0W0GEU4_MONRR|nr:hypothetical protein WG66_013528 [Moniliophthora roreri]